MNSSAIRTRIPTSIDKHRIIDLTDSIPDITANLIDDSQHYQLPSELFEDAVFQALNDLIDDFANDPDKYLKPHHQTLIDRTAERYLNDDLNLPSSSPLDEADLPHAEYEIGNVVKVIDSQEKHAEWAVFEVVERRYNPRCFRSTEAYLSETEWYYQLSSHESGDKLIWVRENDICDFDALRASQNQRFWEQQCCSAQNVCTQEIF